jgi:hypothetical protein
VANPPAAHCQVIAPEPIAQSYLTIRDIDLRHVVTVIEVLSPTNKDGGRGMQQYRQKRANVCYAGANLVELDLLRGGQRLPTTQPLPPGDFCAFVTRKWQAPDAAAYVWSLRDRLPSIPIPLAGDDPDVSLELQPVFDGVYDRAGYDYTLNYDRPLQPPLADADGEWAAQLLAARQTPAWLTARQPST